VATTADVSQKNLRLLRQVDDASSRGMQGQSGKGVGRRRKTGREEEDEEETVSSLFSKASLSFSARKGLEPKRDHYGS
jgi:hypothetical protein